MHQHPQIERELTRYVAFIHTERKKKKVDQRVTKRWIEKLSQTVVAVVVAVVVAMQFVCM